MIYHANLKTFSRAKGHSAVAAAAYRSCSKMTDTRTGEVHDYRRKRHHQSGGICTPNGEPVPDREQLWNEAEAVELREKSAVAQEWDIALPRELSKEQQNELAKDLAQMIATHEGTVCQFDVHKGHKKPVLGQDDDQDNPHVHIMHPTRKWAEGHLLRGRLDRVANLLSTADRITLGIAQNRRDDVKLMRERIAVVINRHLEKAGIAERVDHRSYKERGIDRTPQQHMGVAAAAMERRGERTELGDVNRQIIAENKAKAEAAAVDARPAKPWEWEWAKPTPQAMGTKPKPKPKPKAAKRSPCPTVPADIKNAVPAATLEMALEWVMSNPRPQAMPWADYWDKARLAVERGPLGRGLDEAKRDLLASAMTDHADDAGHPGDAIKGAIMRRYGPEATEYADQLEAQARLDASFMHQRRQEQLDEGDRQ